MQILKMADIKTGTQSALIYARPGMGKTTLLGMLPGKTLIVDIDRGSEVLAGQSGDVDVCRLQEDLADLPLLIQMLEKNCPYEFVCIDSLSELEKSMLTVLGRTGKNGGAPELGHYNQAQFKIADYVRRFRALPCNTIFTAWEEPKEVTGSDGTKYQVFRPALSGKTSDIICGLCDTVGRIVITPEKQRIIQLSATNYSVAKDRIKKREYCTFEDLFATAKPAKSAAKGEK